MWVAAHRSFRRLWLASLLSLTGSEISRLGVVLYLFREQESILGLALLVALKALPGAIVAPAAGLVVDRFSKRAVMVGSDLTRMALALGVLAHPTAGVIYVAAALDSIAATFFEPARTAALPLVVDRRDIEQANGLQQSAANVTMIVGPVLGAEIFLAAGLATTLLLDALSFLLSALLIMGVRIRPARRMGPLLPCTVKGEIRAGWSYCRQNALVRTLTVLFCISILCGGLWLPLAPFFIRDVLNGSGRVLGLQFGAFGAGGVVGGLLAPRLARRLGSDGTLLYAALLAEATEFAVYALVTDVGVSTLILFFWGATVSVVGVASYSILQLNVSEEFLGRVFAVLKQGENVALVLAMGLAVVLSERLSSQLVFLAAATFYFVTVAASMATSGGNALAAQPSEIRAAP